ncbi:MAG: hypothetical protein ACK4HQ_00120 [Brevinematales bacterium]
MITIGKITTTLRETAIESRIVQVEVIERRGDTLRLRMNQVETMARTTENVPSEFLALAEVQEKDGHFTVKLTPLEWVNSERLSLHQERSLLNMVIEQLILLGIPSLEDALPWGYALAKKGLPLSRGLLDMVLRLSRRYDKHTMDWLLLALKEGFPLTEETADFLRHLTSWLQSSFAQEDKTWSAEKIQQRMETLVNLPAWIVQVLSTFSWTHHLFSVWREEDMLAMARKGKGQNQIHILIEDNITGRWHIILDWSTQKLTVAISMDPAIWERWHKDIQNWAKDCQKVWRNNFQKEIIVHVHPWENPWLFFLPEEENIPMRGINLYA